MSISTPTQNQFWFFIVFRVEGYKFCLPSNTFSWQEGLLRRTFYRIKSFTLKVTKAKMNGFYFNKFDLESFNSESGGCQIMGQQNILNCCVVLIKRYTTLYMAVVSAFCFYGCFFAFLFLYNTYTHTFVSEWACQRMSSCLKDKFVQG